jgi:Putative Ig domain
MLKRIGGLALVLGLVPAASGFSLLGPVNEAYQVQDIAYNLPGDIGAPKNLGEEYRWNTPVVYYSCDGNFADYFGPAGMDAVDAAFSVLNQLTNVSAYSTDLSEFPLESLRINFQAQALGLFDLKSATLAELVEMLGLAEPERWTWCLHNRFTTPGGTCPPNQVYDVIKRNFDPVPTSLNQLQSSSFVNGNLFSYQIFEICQNGPPLADAVEVSVDPLANGFSAVASQAAIGIYGSFYLGLTRDDVGGLRYLLRTNNMNIEAAGSNTVTFVPDTTPQLLYTSNLTAFTSLALTNGPGALLGFFPDLQIANATPIFTNVVTTNLVFYFTNSPFLPPGIPALVSTTVLTTNVQTYWSYQFANVFITPAHQLISNTNVPIVPGHSGTNGIYSIVTTNIGTSACGPAEPFGSICTSITTTEVFATGYFGDYYILPSNLCDVAIVSTQLINGVTVTGQSLVATNAPGTTNNAGEFFSITPTYSFNQYIYVVHPVTCPNNTVALRQGIDQIRFVRRDYDSLLQRFFYPVTNRYVLYAITNNTLVPQVVERVIAVPDFLMTAQDAPLSPGPADVASPAVIARGVAFDAANAGFGIAGPGTMDASSAGIIYNKVGPIYQNNAPNALDEATASLFFIWGSYDGSTNAPIVYPNGTSITDLENQLLLQVSPNGPALPDGKLGVNYTNAFSGFTATGGTTPYVWSLAPGSPGLPPGLQLNPATGAISGVPTTQNVYDFIVRLTDAGARNADRPYSITINP